jgi:hypothetical protein
MMNEIAFVTEKDDPNIQPNAMGWMLGIEYARAWRRWALSLYLEGLYTDPYLYIMESPFASFITMRRLSQSVKPEFGAGRQYANEKLRYQWIGHSEGRDTIMGALGASLYNDKLSLAFETSFARKGEHDINWDWEDGAEAYDERTPTGTPLNRLIFSIESIWQAADFISIQSYAAQSLYWNFNHQRGDFEASSEVGVAVVFRI